MSFRKLAAWLVSRATSPRTDLWLVITFAVVHALLWTRILIDLKAAQDIHMDVAEAFAWGQKFQLGYGKHPPLTGWIAGLWFQLFPVADWATYLLAMTTLGIGLVICWFVARRVVDRRRAFFVVVMLALYPIFNFKGFKYNPDLLQLVTLPLVVLAYLNAFERRTWLSGILLGLAGASALMTKYWVLTMIGAIGLAALIHPERMRFLRSPAPWVAIATLVVAMIPHLVWLKQVDFVPLTYAGDVYGLSNHMQSAMLVLGYIGHNLALLALPVADRGAGAVAAAALDRARVGARAVERQCVTGAECLDHPGHRRDRSAARRLDLHGLHEDRLGHLAVLPGAAGADRDSKITHARGRGAVDHGDLSGGVAGDARRCAAHRRLSRWSAIPTAPTAMARARSWRAS